MTDHVYLTTQQLADRWNVSTASVRRLVADGTLRALRLSAKIIRFRLSDVEAFEAGHRTIDDAGNPV
jgi:excisionase family DNA binding protein